MGMHTEAAVLACVHMMLWRQSSRFRHCGGRREWQRLAGQQWPAADGSGRPRRCAAAGEYKAAFQSQLGGKRRMGMLDGLSTAAADVAGLSPLHKLHYWSGSAGGATHSSGVPISHPGGTGPAGSGAGATGGAVTAAGPAERHQPPSVQVRRCGQPPGCPNAVHDLIALHFTTCHQNQDRQVHSHVLLCGMLPARPCQGKQQVRP